MLQASYPTGLEGPRGLDLKFPEAVNNAVNCLSTLPSLYLADRCGRRCLLIWGAKVGPLGLCDASLVCCRVVQAKEQSKPK